MIITLPNVRQWWLGKCRLGIQFLPVGQHFSSDWLNHWLNHSHLESLSSVCLFQRWAYCLQYILRIPKSQKKKSIKCVICNLGSTWTLQVRNNSGSSELEKIRIRTRRKSSKQWLTTFIQNFVLWAGIVENLKIPFNLFLTFIRAKRNERSDAGFSYLNQRSNWIKTLHKLSNSTKYLGYIMYVLLN